jgi:hypothetical protein
MGVGRDRRMGDWGTKATEGLGDFGDWKARVMRDGEIAVLPFTFYLLPSTLYSLFPNSIR